MITIASIREIKSTEYDEVWAIVRNLKNGNYNVVSELAPSQSLYSWFYQTKQAGNWNQEMFDTIYVPRFIDEFTKAGKDRLKELRALDKAGKNIALFCYCTDEKMCHRSIIAGILQGMGCNVNIENDYSFYYKMFLQKHGKVRKNTMSLANKYRPTKFEDVCTQEVCTTILNNQIANNSYSHALLFAGSAGSGKTTCARIFANKIDGEIIELDCASHNGVADIKEIVENARVKPLLHEYKVIILDECHTLTPQAWASMLIVLEENLPNSIFVFCTTDTQKIPDTIISRVTRFNFLPIIESDMIKRVQYICKTENIDISDESIEIIAKSAKGNLRQALTNLDKCISYGNLSPDAVRKVLNIVVIDLLKELRTACMDKNTNKIIELIEGIYNNGYELHQFVRQFLDFCVYDVTKTDMKLIETLLTILQDIRYDDSPKNIIIARLIV